ncbi:MAG: type II toxin-antitoxin system RelE/ParE family toxin [Bacteroidetes bacterium]|nr:type II toxin-antitoxin system RelE/ParE family toxin [Bacteroidota bacterium]MBL7104632.1 type II toxin-antitoxin system RelE/ParE family toxin [Bacteroidales bacterium]
MDKPEPYKIVLSKKFSKVLKKSIDKKLHSGIEKEILLISEAPYKKTTTIQDPNLPFRKARKGEYRIFVHIDDDTRTLYILNIIHRDRAYKSKE